MKKFSHWWVRLNKAGYDLRSRRLHRNSAQVRSVLSGTSALFWGGGVFLPRAHCLSRYLSHRFLFRNTMASPVANFFRLRTSGNFGDRALGRIQSHVGDQVRATQASPILLALARGRHCSAISTDRKMMFASAES